MCLVHHFALSRRAIVHFNSFIKHTFSEHLVFRNSSISCLVNIWFSFPTITNLLLSDTGSVLFFFCLLHPKKYYKLSLRVTFSNTFENLYKSCGAYAQWRILYKL